MMRGVRDEDLARWRREAFGLAYRMVGEVATAEDVAQESIVAYVMSPEREAVRDPRAFVLTIAARRSVDALRRAHRRRELYVGPWLPEPLVTDPRTPERHAAARETLTLAMLRVLDTLNPVERAVFLLREVFDMPFGAIAEAIDRTPVHCRKLLSRARERIAAERPWPPPERPPEGRQAFLLARLLLAISTNQPDVVAPLIAEDARAWTDGAGQRGAARRVILGGARVTRLLALGARKLMRFDRYELAWLNGQRALLCWRGDTLAAACAFELGGGQVHSLYMIVTPAKLARLQAHFL